MDLSLLNCVPIIARDIPQFVGDHVIRHYRPLGLAALLVDLGLPSDTPELEIIGGIGRLVLRHGSEIWEPTITERALPSPLKIDPMPRITICNTCHAFTENRCTASSCGCAGEGKPDMLSSRCPLGKW